MKKKSNNQKKEIWYPVITTNIQKTETKKTWEDLKAIVDDTAHEVEVGNIIRGTTYSQIGKKI